MSAKRNMFMRSRPTRRVHGQSHGHVPYDQITWLYWRGLVMWSVAMSTQQQQTYDWPMITELSYACFDWSVQSGGAKALHSSQRNLVGIGLLILTWPILARFDWLRSRTVTFIAHAPNASSSCSVVENSDGVPSSFLTRLFSLQESPAREVKDMCL